MVEVGERDVCRASQDIIPIDGAGEPVAARCEDASLPISRLRSVQIGSGSRIGHLLTTVEISPSDRTRQRSCSFSTPVHDDVHNLLSLRQLLELQLRHSALETTATSFSVPAGTQISLQRRTYANVLQNGGGQHSSPETSTIIWTKRSRTSSYSG